jgi:hypothetical protein
VALCCCSFTLRFVKARVPRIGEDCCIRDRDCSWEFYASFFTLFSTKSYRDHPLWFSYIVILGRYCISFSAVDICCENSILRLSRDRHVSHDTSPTIPWPFWNGSILVTTTAGGPKMRLCIREDLETGTFSRRTAYARRVRVDFIRGSSSRSERQRYRGTTAVTFLTNRQGYFTGYLKRNNPKKNIRR